MISDLLGNSASNRLSQVNCKDSLWIFSVCLIKYDNSVSNKRECLIKNMLAPFNVVSEASGKL